MIFADTAREYTENALNAVNEKTLALVINWCEKCENYIIDRANEGESFVSIHLPEMPNGMNKDVFKKIVGEYFESYGYKVCFPRAWVNIGW